MPTGIEEAVVAAGALIAQAAALSPFSGNPDPNGAFEAADSAVFAASPILDVDIQEGTSSVVAAAEPPIDAGGASRAPADGDHPPPPGGVYERPAIFDGQPVTEFTFTDPFVVVGPDPADAPVPAPADAPNDAGTAPGARTPETGVPPQPATDPPWLPPMNVPPAGPSIVQPPMTAPATSPAPSGGGIGVPADWADAWERNSEYSWSKLLWDKTGEELNRDVKKQVEDWLGEWQRNTDENGEDASESAQSVRGANAATATTVFDVVFGMLVLPVLDPSSVARGYLRTGVSSAYGVEDIQQDRVLEGSAKIAGEVGSVVLTVAGGVKAVQAKGVPPAPGESTVTVFLKEGGNGKYAVISAHTEVRIKAPAKGAAVAIDKFTDVVLDIGPKGEVLARATSKTFDSAKSMRRASFTRRLSPEAARRVAAFADAASNMEYKGLKGGIAEFATDKGMILRALDTGRGRTGPFSSLGEHCGTYAAAAARAGGFVVSGRFGPQAVYLMFKYGSAPGLGLLATGVAVGMLGNQGPGPTAPPPN